jgi:hypothetical protein
VGSAFTSRYSDTRGRVRLLHVGSDLLASSWLIQRLSTFFMPVVQGTCWLEPTHPAVAFILLCRFRRQVSQHQRNLSAGPANKAFRLRLGAGTPASGCHREQTGSRKRRTQMYTMNQDHDHRLHRLRCRSSLHPERHAQCTLSVATKESWKDADGNWQSRADWHWIVFLGSRRSSRGH